jgi:aspartate/methionine/tyrosine aminotransferase
MWLDMCGVTACPLPTRRGLLPHPDDIALSPRTKAIVLVTPNNPAGVEYPADLVAAFYTFAQEHGLTLIVDETYRDFDSRSGPPHELFQQPNWPDNFVHLYSFSKTYRLTGHRVGAIAASPARLAEAEKFLDTVAICPGQVGQRAALWGLEHLGQWVAGERAEILTRRAAIETHMPKLAREGWQLLGLGAYFAYLRHPFDMPSDLLAPALVKEAGILCLPGTMFRPDDDSAGQHELRIAFANLDAAGIAALFDRLSQLDEKRLSLT